MIFDYTQLQLIWWLLIFIVLLLYATTAGMDFGVTMYLPFASRHKNFADADVDRRAMLNTIAPTWDGNQTWLVFAGGCLFGIWPMVYSTLFSALYPAFLLILYSFFLRPPGFDYRAKLPTQNWRYFWDWSLFVSAFFPVIVFGLVLGNLFVGLPFSFDDFYLKMTYDGTFFELFNVFGVVAALMGLCMCLMQGGFHLNRRLSGELARTYRHKACLFALGYMILAGVAILLLAFSIQGLILQNPGAHTTTYNTAVEAVKGGWLHNYRELPVLWLVPAWVFGGAVLAMLLAPRYKAAAFWASCSSIAALLAAAAIGLYPFVVPSGAATGFVSEQSGAGAASLTIWNISAPPYTLMGMIYICMPVLIAALIVKILGMRAIWRDKKYIEPRDVLENSHTFY